MHAFDGFRTSHEIARVKPIPYEDIKKIFPNEKLIKENVRKTGLNPHNPVMRGTAMRPDIFF